MSPSPLSGAQALVDALADPARRAAAYQSLLAAGPAARAAVLEGTHDGRWQVRRWCAIWLFHCPDPADFESLVPLLRDPRSKVRFVAMVALGVAHARVESHEIVPLLLERLFQDESLRVRRQAAVLLAWNHAHPDLAGVFAELERESDPKLRAWGRIGSARC
ncbi:MAG TPA: HEAT repeat domain-containing protein [Myxococcota bacterium]|nr:HEAT repeat domain-containing protein [Myxococcota bacterium]